MDKTKNNIMKIVILIIFLLLFVLGFTYLRFFIVLFLVCMAVIDLIRKKKIWRLQKLLLIVLLYFSISPGRFPFLFQSLERMRFMILQNQYENEAEVILKNYLEDVDYQMIEGCNWMLTSHGTVNYQRKRRKCSHFLYHGLYRGFRLCILFQSNGFLIG